MGGVSLENYKNDRLYPKIVKAIGFLLQEKDEIATVDVLIKLGNLAPKDYDAWRRGKIGYLERVFQGSLSKAGRILRLINFHMHDLNMVKTDKTYKELNGKRILRFSKSGIKMIEEVYSRQFKWNRSQEMKIIQDSISSEK